MCGIAGTWGQADEPAVREMMRRMTHRGPDAEGMHRHESVATLGHRRLSIMDPHGGDQPIYTENGSAAIIANGEIYNFHGLRQRLEARHQFGTTSDSEVVVHLFEEAGTGSAQWLDGMFAFAITDGQALMLARDPVGIKPLYYGVKDMGSPNEVTHFASELKALADLDLQVKEFPPGTYYHSDEGWVAYYTLEEHAPAAASLDHVCQQVRDTLERSVAKRLMSDVPLGAFLSGGLDSSLIAAMARRHVDQLHTFCVGLEGSPDIEAARTVARVIDSVHHEYIYTIDEVREKLPEILYYLESFDQDLVRSAIPCYFCSRLAADHVKVILTGEGADELFAGYAYYKQYQDSTELHQELHRSVEALHNINLQRVDRMTMAHSIEGRVPFLDLEMIETSLQIPTDLKLSQETSGRQVEKWVLRKACEGLLPPEILWRDKAQFDEGSGTVDLLDELIREMTDDWDGEAYIAAQPANRLRSREEAWYHKLLRDSYGPSPVIFSNVGRWEAQRTEMHARVPSSFHGVPGE